MAGRVSDGVFWDERRGEQIVLKVLSKSRSGNLSYVGHVRLKLNEVYPLCLPGDDVSLPPAAEAVFSKDASTRILQACWWPLDHRAPHSSELYSGGGGTDCRVFKWNVASGSILRSYPRGRVSGGTQEGHSAAVTALVVADAYGVRRLFSASHDGTVRCPAQPGPTPPYSTIFNLSLCFRLTLRSPPVVPVAHPSLHSIPTSLLL